MKFLSRALCPGRLNSHARKGKMLEPRSNWLRNKKPKSSARFNAVQHIHEQYKNKQRGEKACR